MPISLILKFPGTNCDAETARALEAVGFEARVLPSAALTADSLDGVDLLVLAGGFSYGDYVQSGRFARLRIEQALGAEKLKDFVAAGGFVVGICNGFQILTELGLLPEASLIDNASGRFQCRWVKLRVSNAGVPALRYLPEEFELPIAHAEGRLVTENEQAAQELVASGHGALLYAEEVNGAFAQIAGLADDSGRVFGLMPHPERFLDAAQHYDSDWGAREGRERGWGHDFFRGIFAAVTEAREA